MRQNDDKLTIAEARFVDDDDGEWFCDNEDRGWFCDDDDDGGWWIRNDDNNGEYDNNECKMMTNVK